MLRCSHLMGRVNGRCACCGELLGRFVQVHPKDGFSLVLVKKELERLEAGE